jgi:D-threo-aldose 1-dehydrogenase
VLISEAIELDDVIPRGAVRLGFGCGGLYGGRDRRQSLRLLETAIDCGLTYFDTARMYGLGVAESILGEIAPHKRHQMIIATKVGILPASNNVPLRLVTRGIRLLHKAVPRSSRYVPLPATSQLRFHAFSRPALCRSFDKSLQELRTDYIDVLLLHECSAEDVDDPQVLEFLLALKRQGKIRAFGIATGIEQTLRIVPFHASLTSIIQVPSSIFDMNIRRLPPRKNGLTVVHSCLAGKVQSLVSRLGADGALATKWRVMTQVEPRDEAGIAQLLLAHALKANPLGVVLFSTSKSANIRSNVKASVEPVIKPEQIEGLNAFVETILHSFERWPHQSADM